MLTDVLRDRLHQVRLAEPRSAVDEEWVVRLRRRFGDRKRGGVCKPVGRADHEQVERVLRVHATRVCNAGAGAPWRLPGRRNLRRNPFTDRQADMAFLARDVTDGRADQAKEMTLDPLPGEVVRNAEDERIVRELRTPSFRE